ncbi:MAG: hypothetical protein ABIJ08_06915 [Nanoarchaeota archaeon]
MKKAQGLSLQTIIIAAIVLIVLIVLWAIFTGQIGGFSKGVGSTTEGLNACKSRCKALGIYDSDLSHYGPCVATEKAMGKVKDDSGNDVDCCCVKSGASAAASPHAACQAAHPGWSCKCPTSVITRANCQTSSTCDPGLCTDASVLSYYCCQ